MCDREKERELKGFLVFLPGGVLARRGVGIRSLSGSPGSQPADLTMLALCAATAATPPRIAVFGGSGFIGSRVCQTLTGAGCSVVSVSRTGAPPAWAAAQPWSQQVEWLAADALADGFAESDQVGRIDGTRVMPACAAAPGPEP